MKNRIARAAMVTGGSGGISRAAASPVVARRHPARRAPSGRGPGGKPGRAVTSVSLPDLYVRKGA